MSIHTHIGSGVFNAGMALVAGMQNAREDAEARMADQRTASGLHVVG